MSDDAPDLLERIRASIESSRAHLGEIDEMMAELRAAHASHGGSLASLDLLQCLAVERVLQQALQANSERLRHAVERARDDRLR